MSLTKLSLGGKKLNYSRPGRVWSVTSRLGKGKRLPLFYSAETVVFHSLFKERLLYLSSLLTGKENRRGAQTDRLLLPIYRAAALLTGKENRRGAKTGRPLFPFYIAAGKWGSVYYLQSGWFNYCRLTVNGERASKRSKDRSSFTPFLKRGWFI